jgi:hypothetical protein
MGELNSRSGVRINTHSCIISKCFETMELIYETFEMCDEDMHVYVHLL